LSVNNLGTLNASVAAIDAIRGLSPGSRGGGGHILNISSRAGISAVPGQGAYAASKHAVLGFSSSATADLRVAWVTDTDLSSICPDGLWTPMLYDKLEAPRAALSFSGVLPQPSDVVRAVGKVLDKPRPVTATPAWRGAISRLGAAFPRLGAAAMPLMEKQGRRAQKKLLRSNGPTRR